MVVGQGGTVDAPPLAPRAQLRWDVVRPIIASIRPRTTIEIGVGQGAASVRIARMSESFVGVELDKPAYDRAVARLSAVGATVHNATLADVDPEPADLVCAFEVLEHIADDRGALLEWSSYVRPGGTLLLSVPADPDRFGPSDTHAGHYRRYAPATLEAMLSEAGFRDIHVRYYNAPLGYALEAVRNVIDGRRQKAAVQAPAEVLTAASGRTFQFSGRSWLSYAVGAGVAPFRALQRVWPGGTGLVATATK
jgi:2-polyprenyl-3-methyl-5-hydroxy-6-metoxy-1,4-benzoquinol methylase